eukprot:6178994-Pleurochrysis_carterae.AAC.1
MLAHEPSRTVCQNAPAFGQTDISTIGRTDRKEGWTVVKRNSSIDQRAEVCQSGSQTDLRADVCTHECTNTCT